MPVYDYKCQSCGQQIEKIQKFSDPPLTRCETCGGPLVKLLSPPALVFKGSGWYITDYSRKGKSKEGADASTEKKGSEAGKNKSDAGGSTSAGASKPSGSDSPAPKKKDPN